MSEYDEFLREDVDVAYTCLMRQVEDKNFETIEEGTITTCEYVANRVRIWYNPVTHLVTKITHG